MIDEAKNPIREAEGRGTVSWVSPRDRERFSINIEDPTANQSDLMDGDNPHEISGYC